MDQPVSASWSRYTLLSSAAMTEKEESRTSAKTVVVSFCRTDMQTLCETPPTRWEQNKPADLCRHDPLLPWMRHRQAGAHGQSVGCLPWVLLRSHDLKQFVDVPFGPPACMHCFRLDVINVCFPHMSHVWPGLKRSPALSLWNWGNGACSYCAETMLKKTGEYTRVKASGNTDR